MTQTFVEVDLDQSIVTVSHDPNEGSNRDSPSGWNLIGFAFTCSTGKPSRRGMGCDPDNRDVPERADLAGRQTRFLPGKLAQTLEI